jgi:hypothetical protein
MTALPADIYRPELWHDFFIMTGGASAALTGLVFVAMSLNLRVIFRDATNTYRAIGTLAGFVSAFMVSAFALMGEQNHVSLGLDWLLVSSVASYIYWSGIVVGNRRGGSGIGVRTPRIVLGTLIYLAQNLGAIVLLLGNISVLYIAATAMILSIPFSISGAWLLLVGIHRGQSD